MIADKSSYCNMLWLLVHVEYHRPIPAPQALPVFPALPALIIIPSPGGDLASTGLMKELQRVQVQVPGKTVWNDSTANSELAMAA
jgi:hypothetical protein